MDWDAFLQITLHTASNGVFWALADVFMWRSFGMPFQDMGRAALFVSLLSLIFSPIAPQTILLFNPIHIIALLIAMFITAWYVILAVRYGAVLLLHDRKK
jgi:hypothetical protein